ncbi:MAG: DUF177 domain-containing protein [bacterium]
MKIDLTELLQHLGNEADFEISEKVSFAADDLALSEPLKIKLHLTNVGESVLVNGQVSTRAELECTRCLKKYQAPLTVKIEEDFSKTPPNLPRKKEIDLTEEDFVYQIDDDNCIDITEVTRQHLLLNVPIKTLCSPDCEGIKERGDK